MAGAERLGVWRLGEAERLPIRAVEPVRDPADTELVLHREILAVGFVDFFRGRVTETVVDVHEHRHGQGEYRM